MSTKRLNDDERRMWVLNDESLYNMQRFSGQSMREFIRGNREMLDGVINKALAPREKSWRDY